MQEEYRGFVIEYDETMEKFEVLIGESRLSSKKLPDLRRRIDNHGKKEKTFTRIDVLCGNPWGGSKLNKGQITSIADDGEVWVTVGKERRKRKVDGIYLDNPKNNLLYKTIKENKQKVKIIESEIERLFAEMDKPDIKTEDNGGE